MNIVQFFDVNDDNHLKAFVTLLETGSFPPNFIPSNIEYVDNWNNKISNKVSLTYCKNELDKLTVSLMGSYTEKLTKSLFFIKEELITDVLNKYLPIGWSPEDLYERLKIKETYEGTVQYLLDNTIIIEFNKPKFIVKDGIINVQIKVLTKQGR